MRAEHPRAKRETRPFSKKKNMPRYTVYVWGLLFIFTKGSGGGGCGGGGYVVVCSRSLSAGEYIYRSREPFPIRGDKWM